MYNQFNNFEARYNLLGNMYPELIALLLIVGIAIAVLFAFVIDNNKSKNKNTKKIKNKIICPKCNTENYGINSFCTNCHHFFTIEEKTGNVMNDKEVNKEIEDLKKQIKLLKEEIKKEKTE